MARVKISELPELNIATLDTTYVAGVYDNTTYKIAISRLTSSLDTTFATDLVVNAISGTISTLATTESLNTLSISVDSRIDTLETFSSSADNRYVLSGSITQTTWDNIQNKPNDIISSSTQISDLGFVTGSYTTLNSFNNLTQSFNSISQSFTTISGSFGDIDFSGINAVTESYLEFTQSYYSASASVDIRITTEKNRIDAILSASNANSDTFAEVVSLINSVDLTNDNVFATFYTASNGRLTSLENATSSYLTLLNGAITSSSQLTSSFDTRYTLSGSVQPLPNGLISGSSQLTSSFDDRYTLSSSFSSVSSSFDSRFNGLVTTGSNTFSGSQIFSGSMTVTSGQVIASTITNNSSSLFLQSGSNIYVQNDGLVEITGSLTVSGSTTIKGPITINNAGGAGGTSEGGQINFALAAANQTLTSSVAVDVYQDTLRIFEEGGNNRGVKIDLSKAPTGVNGELLWKASGIVNAGTFVTLDNLKATVPSSGNRGLSLATVSGTINGYISGHYQGISSSSSGVSGATTITTSATTSIFGWNFGAEGDMVHYILRDNTNSRVYRILLIIGGSYLNNFISIEKLH